jgi:hypothetical protein
MIEANYILNNQSPKGGGIRTGNRSKPTLINNVLRDNFADYGGGLHVSQKSSLVSVNNTIYRNHANWLGGAVYGTDTSKTLFFNSIIQDNAVDSSFYGAAIINATSNCTTFIDYSIVNRADCFVGVSTFIFGSSNLSGGAVFMDSLCHLDATSRAIDRGYIVGSSPWGDILLGAFWEIDKEGRPNGTGWDLGADESPFNSIAESSVLPEIVSISVSPNPFNSRVSIDAIGSELVEIISTDGRIVFRSFVPSFIWNPSYEIPSGVYQVRALYPDGKNQTAKIVLIK